MTQKEREEGASHTLLTVRLITYQHHSFLSNIPYSAALLIPFDRRWLISFMAFVLMTQTYKRLLKLKWGLQKLKWLIFFIVVQIQIPYDILEQTHCLLSNLVIFWWCIPDFVKPALSYTQDLLKGGYFEY